MVTRSDEQISFLLLVCDNHKTLGGSENSGAKLKTSVEVKPRASHPIAIAIGRDWNDFTCMRRTEYQTLGIRRKVNVGVPT
jgi:hypothetical protein